MKLELDKSKTSAKRAIVKIEERIINTGESLLAAKTALLDVESRLGANWSPLDIISAKANVKHYEEDIADLEKTLEEVHETVTEYLS